MKVSEIIPKFDSNKIVISYVRHFYDGSNTESTYVIDYADGKNLVSDPVSDTFFLSHEYFLPKHVANADVYEIHIVDNVPYIVVSIHT